MKGAIDRRQAPNTTVHARWRRFASAALAIGLAASGTPAGAVSLIRDAEIEATIDEMSQPVFEAAGLGADSVDMYIVQDPTLNAFVAGGMNMFLNTGFLMRTEDPGQMVGVIAHEAGHIAAGHLSRVTVAQQRATAEMILGTVLGLATAVAGVPGLGAALITGGQAAAQSSLSRFSVSQEQQADQAALTYLDSAGVSPAGLAEFFHILETQNVLSVSASNPYLRSHPLTRDRIAFVENAVRSGTHPSGYPPGWVADHARMVAKLRGFLDEPREVLQRYPEGGDLPARYARAIALYRLPDLPAALVAVDELIAESPNDPYFYELKGQMLFEHGRIEDAIPAYRESVRLKPDSALLRLGLGQALVETGTDNGSQEAIPLLKEAVRLEPDNAGAWRMLGIAEGRAGDPGEASLALAEFALLAGKDQDARLYLQRAEHQIEPGDEAWLHLQDLQQTLLER
jgi:predicted Zn-dependent protease